MSFEAYITCDPATGEERGFEHPFERAAVLQIARSLWRKYHKSKMHCCLIANLVDPPADVVIFTQSGLGVVELKEYAGVVHGTDESAWYIIEDDQKIEIPSNYTNPLGQVRYYRRKLKDQIQSFATSNAGIYPTQMVQGNFYFQATVVFTAQKFSLENLALKPSAVKPWFSIHFLDEVADWTFQLAFTSKGASREERTQMFLTRGQMEHIITNAMHAQSWKSIEGLLESEEPYGYLWVMKNGQKSWPLTLDQEEMHIGRSPDNALYLTNYGYVSRVHALVRRTPDGVWITDQSKHGTWVNGKKLTPGVEHLLKEKDCIILGFANNGESASPDSCKLVYETRIQDPITTKTW
jgi:hypothetical protein